MGILALVLGILSLIFFDWIGAFIGVAVTTVSAAQALSTGTLDVSSTPIWGFGIGIGVCIPLISAIVGIAAIKKPKIRTFGIVGLVCSICGLLIGIGFTAFMAISADISRNALSNQDMTDAANQLNQAINDPALQQALTQGLEEMQKQQQQQK